MTTGERQHLLWWIWLTPAHSAHSARLSDEELETLVEMGEEEGALHEAEGEMIQEIIKLGDKTAKDCMTPRVDMFTLPDDLTNDEAIARLKEKRHRRVPVYAIRRIKSSGLSM